MTLYDLTEEYKQLLDMIEDPEVDEETWLDTMEAIEGELHDKADSYVFVMKEIEGKIEMRKKEEKRIAEMRRREEASLERIKGRLQASMEYAGEKKFETDHFKFWIQKNPPSVVVDDEARVPFEYWTTPEPVVDKKALKDFLKENTCDFAHLEPTESLRIK